MPSKGSTVGDPEGVAVGTAELVGLALSDGMSDGRSVGTFDG